MRRTRILRLGGGAAGLAAVALVAGGALSGGAPASLAGAASVPSLPGVPTSLPTGATCFATPAPPATGSPVSAAGGGQVSSPAGGGALTASGSGLKLCVSPASAPSLPSLPGAPSLPAPPSGLPGLPTLPAPPSGLPGLPHACPRRRAASLACPRCPRRRVAESPGSRACPHRGSRACPHRGSRACPHRGSRAFRARQVAGSRGSRACPPRARPVFRPARSRWAEASRSRSDRHTGAAAPRPHPGWIGRAHQRPADLARGGRCPRARSESAQVAEHHQLRGVRDEVGLLVPQRGLGRCPPVVGPTGPVVGEQPLGPGRAEEVHREIDARREPVVVLVAEAFRDRPGHAIREREDGERVERAVGEPRWIVEPVPAGGVRADWVRVPPRVGARSPPDPRPATRTGLATRSRGPGAAGRGRSGSERGGTSGCHESTKLGPRREQPKTASVGGADAATTLRTSESA